MSANVHFHDNSPPKDLLESNDSGGNILNQKANVKDRGDHLDDTVYTLTPLSATVLIEKSPITSLTVVRRVLLLPRTPINLKIEGA